MGDDTPAVPRDHEPEDTPFSADKKPSGLLITLVALGTALLIAIIAILLLLMFNPREPAAVSLPSTIATVCGEAVKIGVTSHTQAPPYMTRCRT